MSSVTFKPEVAGDLGDQTVMDASVHPPVVLRLHYVFSSWSGDDIVEGFPCFLVSSPLAEAITAEGLTGAELDDAIVSVEPQLQEFFPDVVAKLPPWKWLKVHGRQGDDLWLDEMARLHLSDRACRLVSRFSVSAAEMTRD